MNQKLKKILICFFFMFFIVAVNVPSYADICKASEIKKNMICNTEVTPQTDSDRYTTPEAVLDNSDTNSDTGIYAFQEHVIDQKAAVTEKKAAAKEAFITDVNVINEESVNNKENVIDEKETLSQEDSLNKESSTVSEKIDYEEEFQDIPGEYLTDDYRKVYEYIYTIKQVENRKLDMTIDGNGMFRMIDPETGQSYRVLQLTDIHITGGDINYQKDILAVDAVYDLINRTKPDFVVMTGDVIFGTQETSTQDGKRAMDVVARFMDRIGIPWAWTFGNHDHDFMDRFSISEVAQMLAKSKTLRAYTKQDQITGYTNGVYQLCDEKNNLVMALILIDSNDLIYDENGDLAGYDYIHDDQSEWFVSKINNLHDIYKKMPENLLFFHIPLKEYETAWIKAEASKDDPDSEVKLLFGSCNEKICASNHDSLLFQKAVDLGCTRAIFCGHDHTNDFGVSFMNIKLIYSKSIDFVAYPGIDQLTEQRGATLITINKNSEYQIEQISFK